MKTNITTCLLLASLASASNAFASGILIEGTVSSVVVGASGATNFAPIFPGDAFEARITILGRSEVHDPARNDLPNADYLRIGSTVFGPGTGGLGNGSLFEILGLPAGWSQDSILYDLEGVSGPLWGGEVPALADMASLKFIFRGWEAPLTVTSPETSITLPSEQSIVFNLSPTSVTVAPEPSSIVLAILGAIGLAVVARRMMRTRTA